MAARHKLKIILKAILSKRTAPILAIAIAALMLVSLFPHFAVPAVSSKKASTITVVFNGQTLPADAATRISAAGGQMIRSISEIGVATARPTTVSEDSFIANLRSDPAIWKAGHDSIAELIAPVSVVADDDTTSVQPDTGPSPHPICPGSFCPPTSIIGAPARDRYYIPAAGNVPANQWAIYRVGGFGTNPLAYGPAGGAWDFTIGSPSVTVAIIDTGVSSLHPDVNFKIVDAQSSLFGTTPIDPTFDDGSPEDQQGHGTWTASLAAGALDPAGGLGGVVGVAPGVSIANLKVLVRTPSGGGSGEFAWVTSAIVYAANMGYQVGSMSLGGYFDLTNKDDQAAYVALVRATNYAFDKGTLLVAAAGNDGINLNNIGPFVEAPGSLPNVIAVTATTNPACVENLIGSTCSSGPDGLAFYSNFGSSLHGLAAPGGSLPAAGAIGSTGYVRGACSPGKDTTSDKSGCFTLGHVYYVRAIGTSGSTPLVAGAAALVYSVHPGLRANQVRSILYQTAQDIGKPGYDEFFNFGLVNANAAVVAAMNFNSASDSGDPRFGNGK